MSEVSIPLNSLQKGQNAAGGDLREDFTAIVIDEVTYFDDKDRVYDVRGLKTASVIVTNEHATNGLTWVLQSTKTIIPIGGDLTGAVWTDIDAEASLAALTTALKLYTRVDPAITAIRLRARETVGASDALLGGSIVVANNL